MKMAQTTRDHIIEAADMLFYHQGFEHTSFANIAETVKISRGNFYYHFKSKDDILSAVIELRLARTREMLQRWEDNEQNPTDRITSFIRIQITNMAKIKQYGCPVGTLCTELAKLHHTSLADATKLFTLFRTWLARQFRALGRQTDADQLAMHLLAASQGVATLAQSFQDEKFVRREVDQMCTWLETIVQQTD